MRTLVVVVVASAALGVAACDETALVFEVRGAQPVPAQLDAVCLSVAALDQRGEGGAFAQRYALPSLPQTLTVLPGGHARVQAWARGTRDGLEVARAGGTFAVGGGVETHVLDLSTCPGGDLVPRVAGTAPAPAGARAAVLLGWRAPITVVISPGAAARYGGSPVSGLVARDGGVPAAPAGGVAQLLAFDADGDCDDDLLVGSVATAPALWRLDGDGALVDAGADAGLGGLGALAAAVAGDLDGDLDLDLVVVDGGVVKLLRNDGAGRFVLDAAAIPVVLGGDATAVALGDVSGDGHADLIVGTGSADPGPRHVLVNDGAGAGIFALAPGVLPDLAERTRALAVADVDADGDLDLVSAGLGAPVRLYVNRGDGRLEDRSFVRLPGLDAVDVGAGGLVVADLDGDCRPDLALTRVAGATTLWRGGDAGVFVAAVLPGGAAGSTVSGGDVDGDGRFDLALVDGTQVTWVAPR